MPLSKNPKYIHEQTPLQCGQAVLAMLSDTSNDEIITLVRTDRETTLKQMFSALDSLGICYNPTRIEAGSKAELPPICILSLETPRCWHWSLYYKGVFLDPEHGVLSDFPICRRKYYWEILE